jgi:hypothetical protein
MTTSASDAESCQNASSFKRKRKQKPEHEDEEEADVVEETCVVGVSWLMVAAYSNFKQQVDAPAEISERGG